jgi:N-acetylmuramoyl-L-alanine amidase
VVRSQFEKLTMGRPSRGRRGCRRVVPFLLALGTLLPLIAISPARAARSTVLTGVRWWSGHDKTRIVIDTNQPVTFEQATDRQNNVSRVTLPQSVLSPDVARIFAIQDGLIQDIRVAEVPSGLELLIRLTVLREVSGFTLEANDTQPFRVVIDVPRQGIPLEVEFGSSGIASNAPLPRVVAALPPAATTPPSLRIDTERERIVIIDPGHGGEHTGAVGYRRAVEKVICLSISKKLAARLNKEPGLSALLTRTGDYNVGLRDRYRFADSCRADAFVSIHTNSSRRRTSAGTEVFFLTLGSASDEQAKLLADLENAADIVDGGSIFEEDVTGILFDLKQKDVLRQSERLAEAILNNLTEDRRLSSRGVKQARFAVLKSPITPSVLVETAFINNPREAKLLRDPEFQEQIADQIAEGLLRFMATTPTVARDGGVKTFLDRALARQNGKH